MTNQELLISRIIQLSEDEISSVLNTVTLMLEAKELTRKHDCPYCGSPTVIRYGHKCTKQSFRCKSCVRTFVTTTNTIMSNSHFQASVWKEMIKDTLQGNAIAATSTELISIFEGHIADETLVLCDGLRSYHAFPGIADCTVKDCSNRNREDSCFYNLNAVNGFHSFIKQCYEFYRGVASKYINRYNALFSTTYRNGETMIRRRMADTFRYFA